MTLRPGQVGVDGSTTAIRDGGFGITAAEDLVPNMNDLDDQE